MLNSFSAVVFLAALAVIVEVVEVVEVVVWIVGGGILSSVTGE